MGADPKIVPKGDHHAGYRYPLHDHQISDSSNPFAVHQLAVAKCRYGSCMDGARGARGNLTFLRSSGAVMYSACFRLEACPHRDAAAMAAGPDVIR